MRDRSPASCSRSSGRTSAAAHWKNCPDRRWAAGRGCQPPALSRGVPGGTSRVSPAAQPHHSRPPAILLAGGRRTGPALRGGFGRTSRDASPAISHQAIPAAGQEGKPMSDSQTVTIPAAEHAATAETRPARLLRALAQNPEPLSAPALASLLAEPGRRRRLLSSYDRALRRHEKAGHVERAGRERKGRGRPAIIWRITPAGRLWLDDHDQAPALAAAAAAAKHGARPPNGTRPWTKPAPPSTARLRGSAANAPLTSSENSAAPSTRSARSSTSAKKESARTSSGTRRHANPRENPSRAPTPPQPNASPPGPVTTGAPLTAPGHRGAARHGGRRPRSFPVNSMAASARGHDRAYEQALHPGK